MRADQRCTYRVQLRDEFDFAAATNVVPYLAELGASHLYCSPYMQAARGSAHGYDVVDPTSVSRDLGGDAGLALLDEELRRHGVGQLLDIVPNHMCVTSPDNRLWWDVLRNGRKSAYAGVFDIDWEAPGLAGRVLLPVLGAPLEDLLHGGELHVAHCGDDMELRYHEQRFPLRPDVPAAEGAATLHLLEQQHYLLEHWRTGLRRLNYRRFLDVSSLAGVCVEERDVFELVHARALELLRDGIVDGLRVDHVDGLRDPAAYLDALRAAAGDAWIVVEKVLAQDEDLPARWAVQGTTGYDFTARALTLCVDPDGLRAVHGVYTRFTSDVQDYDAQSRAARVQVLEELLSAELDRLAGIAAAAGIDGARTELAQLLAGMPVYRIYPHAWEPLSAGDRARLQQAAADAAPCDGCDTGRVAALVAVLSADTRDTAPRRDLRARFSQLSSALMAKGVEDTTFYRHVPLAALDEVGCDPRGVLTVDELHAAAQHAAEHWPRSLLTTATHDTKRGEDARVRIAMLSEMPAAWEEAVLRWSGMAQRYRSDAAPSRTAEYLLYQTLVGAHPLNADRASAYMLKAAREPKQETSWLDPDATYEAALDAFVRGVVEDSEIDADVARFVAAMTPAWHTAALSQTLLKLTSPGVADIYQGSELWDLRLVDPDNRTPVDFGLRRTLLRELRGLSARDVMRRAAEGMPKLHVVRSALRVRRDVPAVFGQGSSYRPLHATGSRAAHAVAYARGAGEVAGAITIAVRHAFTLNGDWDGTTLDVPAGSWRNAFTGEQVDGGAVQLSELLCEFPVALLQRVS